MTDRQPNVILILTDDQGWDDLGHHNPEFVETPHLDKLARNSVQFANYYVAAVCAPSRASLLTGRHFMRTGVSHVHGGKDFIHPDEVLVSDVFRAAGYATAMFGKWHSGKTSGYFPWERGFDEAYMARLYKHRDSTGHLNGRPVAHEGWTVDTLTDYATDFIERNADRPFFLFLPHLTVHAPLVAPDDLVSKYRDKGLGETLSLIYAMVDKLDQSVGRLLALLEELRLEEDTIVLFMSDNGPQYFGDRLPPEDLARRYHSGYKGHKGNMWENGIKSPLSVRWPGRFQPRTVQRLVDICDVMPTLLDLCCIDLPDGHPALDGRSVRPYLEGDEASLPPKESFIYVNPAWPPHEHEEGQYCAIHDHEYDPVPPEAKPELRAGRQWMGMRTEDFKLLQNPGCVPGAPYPVEGRVLVHMAEDPREDVNVYAQHPRVSAEMDARLEAWFGEIVAEPHSYHAPQFLVGPGTTNLVYLYCPVRIRGERVRNKVHFLEGMARPGDAAEYRLRVQRPGRYRLTLSELVLDGDELPLTVSLGEQRLDFVLRGEEPLVIGELDLPSGDSILTLEVAADRPVTATLTRATLLRFEPV